MYIVTSRTLDWSCGPFASRTEAKRFIKAGLGSSPKYYRVAALLSPALWVTDEHVMAHQRAVNAASSSTAR